MKNLTCCALLALAVGGNATAAEPAGYTEIGYAPLRVSGSGLEATPGVGIVRLGYELTRRWAVELVGGDTLHDGRMDILGVPVGIKVSLIGAHMKASFHPAPELDLYARLGMVRTRLEGAVAGYGSASGSDDSASFGVGAQFQFGRRAYVALGYDEYFDKSGGSIRGPGLAVGWRF